MSRARPIDTATARAGTIDVNTDGTKVRPMLPTSESSPPDDPPEEPDPPEVPPAFCDTVPDLPAWPSD